MKPTTTLLFTAITAASLFAGAIQAQSSDRLPVSELKPLLKLAIERGEARGVLTGESAAYMKQKFGTTAALEIDVRTLHPLPQPGCSRLEVTSRQNGVLEKGKHEDKALTYQLNYCRDGGFPNKN
jgi:hypothetical protein